MYLRQLSLIGLNKLNIKYVRRPSLWLENFFRDFVTIRAKIPSKQLPNWFKKLLSFYGEGSERVIILFKKQTISNRLEKHKIFACHCYFPYLKFLLCRYEARSCTYICFTFTKWNNFYVYFASVNPLFNLWKSVAILTIPNSDICVIFPCIFVSSRCESCCYVLKL